MTDPIALRATLLAAWTRALVSLDPRRLVSTALSNRLSTQEPPALIAAGKASLAMAAGAIDALGCVSAGLVVTTDQTNRLPLPETVRRMNASHPIPDARSVAAASAALHLARTTRASELIVLISGGTSSLLCAPNGLSLDEKQSLTDHLLRSGENIHACNTVRRHLSAIKGGRLAAVFHGPVLCLIVSDVVGGEAYDVGSGPACADPTTIDDARRILQRLPHAVSARGEAALTESVKPSSAIAGRLTVHVLAAPVDLARRFARELSATGWQARADELPRTSARELSRRLVERAGMLAPGEGWVVACEPTLTVPEHAGRGGRAGWVALHASAHLPDDVVLWAAASDGVDGTSGTAGACVVGSQAAKLDRAMVERHLRARDDTELHRRMGTSLPGGPTGTNLTDAYAVLRVRA